MKKIFSAVLFAVAVAANAQVKVDTIYINIEPVGRIQTKIRTEFVESDKPNLKNVWFATERNGNKFVISAKTKSGKRIVLSRKELKAVLAAK